MSEDCLFPAGLHLRDHVDVSYVIAWLAGFVRLPINREIGLM